MRGKQVPLVGKMGRSEFSAWRGGRTGGFPRVLQKTLFESEPKKKLRTGDLKEKARGRKGTRKNLPYYRTEVFAKSKIKKNASLVLGGRNLQKGIWGHQPDF